jgi:hypothetical protein
VCPSVHLGRWAVKIKGRGKEKRKKRKGEKKEHTKVKSGRDNRLRGQRKVRQQGRSVWWWAHNTCVGKHKIKIKKMR